MNGDSERLLAEYMNGNDKAAEAILNRYAQRLIALARSRLSAQLKRRIDPEDITQSAYRSFFRRAKDGEFTLQRCGDLWRLLAGITVRKALKRVEHERAQRRDFRKEVSSARNHTSEPLSVSTFEVEPAPEQPLIMVEELSSVMKILSDRDKLILERRLQDECIEMIAADVGVSESTVRRALKGVREQLERRFFE